MSLAVETFHNDKSPLKVLAKANIVDMLVTFETSHDDKTSIKGKGIKKHVFHGGNRRDIP